MLAKAIFKAVKDELRFAKKKWPTWPMGNQITASAIVMEEAGELVQAALDYQWHSKPESSKDKIMKEAIQTAAMAIRLIENL